MLQYVYFSFVYASSFHFLLCNSNSINRALLKLSVKDERNEAVRAQRLRLFAAARQILHDGMVILGLRPLEKM